MADRQIQSQRIDGNTIKPSHGKLLNVLHLIAPTHFGGAERAVLNLVESIDRSLFNVIVGAFVNIHFPKNEFVGRLKEKKYPAGSSG